MAPPQQQANEEESAGDSDGELEAQTASDRRSVPTQTVLPPSSSVTTQTDGGGGDVSAAAPSGGSVATQTDGGGDVRVAPSGGSIATQTESDVDASAAPPGSSIATCDGSATQAATDSTCDGATETQSGGNVTDDDGVASCVTEALDGDAWPATSADCRRGEDGSRSTLAFSDARTLCFVEAGESTSAEEVDQSCRSHDVHPESHWVCVETASPADSDVELDDSERNGETQATADDGGAIRWELATTAPANRCAAVGEVTATRSEGRRSAVAVSQFDMPFPGADATRVGFAGRAPAKSRSAVGERSARVGGAAAAAAAKNKTRSRSASQIDCVASPSSAPQQCNDQPQHVATSATSLAPPSDAGAN